MAQVDSGVLRAILNKEALPRRQPIVELHTWKGLGNDRLNCTLVDGQNVARGVTQAGIPVQQAIERLGHQPMLLSLQRWTAQETSGTPFLLIQEASVMGPTQNRAQPHELNNLSKRAVSEVPLTQAMHSESDISEALTQPGPVLADNIYSRPYGAPAVAAAAAPDMGAAMPGSGGILGRAPEARIASSPSAANSKITPLKALNSYIPGPWKIKARVLTKSDVRKFNNSRGEGQLFKVDLKDPSGEMSATFFGRAVDKYHPMLKCGQVYTFQRGQVKAANKRYDSGDFVLSFEERAEIKAVEEDSTIPRMSYDFKPLCDVANMPPETSVDVKAVVYSVQAPFTFVAKTSNKEMTKREIGLWDPSGPSGHSTMELVLWNERAVGTDFEIGAVVFLKKVRISEFNQMKSLSSPAQLELHPDHEDSFLLMRKFKEFQDSGKELPSPSKPYSNASSGQRKTIEECKQEDLKLASPGALPGGPEKGVHKHMVKATLTSLPTDRAPYYSACPQQVESNAPVSRPAATMRTCNKKVSQRDNGEWTCMGGHVSSYPEFRYLCRLNVLDHTDQMEVNLYDDVMKNLLGREARDYVAIFEAAHNGGEGAQPLQEVNEKMEWKRYSLVLRSSKEIWQENERVRYSVDSAQPIPLEQDARQMLGDIMASLEA